MNFANFLTIPTMAILVKNFKNHIKGEFVKIRDFILVIIFCDFRQKWLFRLVMKIFKFLGIHPTLKAKVRLEDHDEMDFGRERENGPIRRPLGRQSLDSGFRHNEKKANERNTLVTNYSSFLDMTLEKNGT